MLKKLKPYMMPISMIMGAVFHTFFGKLSFITPYLIFIMLFLTFSNLKLQQIKFNISHLWLLLFQLAGSIGVYLILQPINKTLAQGAMICVLAPTGTAAPTVTGMLGGSVASITAYSLIINIAVALAAPAFFSLVGSYQQLPFIESFWFIGQRVFVLLLLPLFSIVLLRKWKPKVVELIGSSSGFAFYVWSVALVVVTARTVDFMQLQPRSSYLLEIFIALAALVVCVLQFFAGRVLGKKYDDTIAMGQSFGQKNTILAIWMAQMFLNPLASIGPGMYVVWQNIINSYQVWLNRKNL